VTIAPVRKSNIRCLQVHPALHNANLSACVPGEIIVLPASHAKERRNGYRKVAGEQGVSGR
jgi:hypothetical protein